MLRRSLRLALALLVPALALSSGSGCGSKDSVALSAWISDAQLGVQSGTLGDRLSGSFVLNLELGPEASGSTTVTLEDFALAPAGGTEDLVPAFAPEPSESFPLTLSAGDKKQITMTIPDGDTLSDTQTGALCAGDIEIRASVRDSLGDDAITSVRSAALSVAGCP
ncbi:MAG: hypothetical protein H6718_31490 [Polyangiaceae bacterium]|nr:hypothetical protein [Polyangiaceae bacterium]